VRSVVRMQNSQIEMAPLPGGMDSEFLAGVAREAGELIVLLNVAAVVRFNLDERGGLR
jgi:chemotaxis signal transduction protein